MAAVSGPNPPKEVLNIRALRIEFTLPDGRTSYPLVNHFNLAVNAGERWAIVGESGSGKSLTARSIMGLIDPPLSWTADVMEIGGSDLARASRAKWRAIRGRLVAMIQQDPLTALSPVFTIGNQLIETIRRKNVTQSNAHSQALSLLRKVGIPDPELRLYAYAHEMSGGMRQRVAIALALACEPQVLIADEPTTALDVAVQAQILKLLIALSEELGSAVVMITHDIGILPDFAHKVAVMYGGRLMEVGPVREVLTAPVHPYTRALLQARPGRAPTAKRRRLPIISGSPPNLMTMQRGCPFAPRCKVALPHCADVNPAMEEVGTRRVACHAVHSDAPTLQ